ncbi:MAG: hypothetical protein WCK58_09120 [Chloroflexota bacterium]
MGGEYTASSVTFFDTGATGQPALWGASGVSVGVRGASTSDIGVHGTSTSGYGVFGSNLATDRAGVLGQAQGNSTGVLGYSGAALVPAASPQTGVYGYADQDNGATGVKGASLGADGIGVHGISASFLGVYGVSASSTGVYGKSTSGNGAMGESISGNGVYGYSTAIDQAAVFGTSAGDSTGIHGHSGVLPPTAAPARTGVYGYAAQDATAVGVSGASTTGTGVQATATTGTALHVVGKARFSRCGRASVAKNMTYVDITVAGGLTANSVVSATLQTYRAGVAIAAVRTNYPAAGKARIYLTKVASTTAATSVGWFAAEY